MKSDNLNSNIKSKISGVYHKAQIIEDKEIGLNKPLIFNKKANLQSVVIPLKSMTSDVGVTRHFAPASQEWNNSVYSYNNDYIKFLPIADKNFMKLVKSYFNMYFSNKILESKQLSTRFKRLSVRKIFVGKGELKHTSSKVIITLYVFNKEQNIINSEINKITKTLLYPNTSLKQTIVKDLTVKYNRPLTINEFLNLPLYEKYLDFTINYVNTINNELKNVINTIAAKRDLSDLPKYEDINLNSFMYTNYDDFIIKSLTWYLRELISYKTSLSLNKAKFEESYLLPLKDLVSKIYNKNVEFNIVQLKKLHLNSDIFTEAITLKLKNRENKLYRVLKSALTRVKIKKINKYIEKNKDRMNRKNLFINKIINTKINLFDSSVKESLNKLLFDIFPFINKADNKKSNNNPSVFKNSVSSSYFISKYIKHINLAGIRIEAKGRLTRRLTASRSVFKVKWKGGLKNFDSSFRGLSTVMLRGHAKSNVQYTMLNSKNRNGAFGVKGWVSNR